MPSTSKKQQRLFGLALSVKRGDTPRSEASQQVLDIVDSMSEKKIKDFASKVKGESVHRLLKKIIKEEIKRINEGKRLTKGHVANIVKDSLRDSSYFGRTYIKKVIVYKDWDDFDRNQKNRWGGLSGDEVPLKDGLRNYSKPNAVFDIFVYERSFDDWNELLDNVVVVIPQDREEEMVIANDYYMPHSLATELYGEKNYKIL